MAEQRKTDGSLALNTVPHVITIPAAEQSGPQRLRVAAYCRVSSDSADQLNSFAAQNAYYTALINGNPDWELVDIYADRGITGTSADKREDFQRLLADCKRGRIDKILVKSISRFARNTKDCLKATRELKEIGVGVCFEEQNIDSSRVSGEMMTAIFAALAQKESESISQNMRMSYHRRMESGTLTPFAAPYGYNIHNHTLEISEKEAHVYWVCRQHYKNISRCCIQRIREETIYNAFLCMYYKLQHQGRSVLEQLLSYLQTARSRRLLWSLDIVELNNQIAELTRQERLLSLLKKQGAVDPDIFISRSGKLAEQLRAAKQAKSRLMDAEEDQTIARTQELLDILNDSPEFLDVFDGELFGELVEKIIVDSNERLRFRLINGLELTETIERMVR